LPGSSGGSSSSLTPTATQVLDDSGKDIEGRGIPTIPPDTDPAFLHLMPPLLSRGGIAAFLPVEPMVEETSMKENRPRIFVAEIYLLGYHS
jgi:hypothetical protein